MAGATRVERRVNPFGHRRRIATRYEKLALDYRAGVTIAASIEVFDLLFLPEVRVRRFGYAVIGANNGNAGRHSEEAPSSEEVATEHGGPDGV